MRKALILAVVLFVGVAAFAQAPALTNADMAKRADSYVSRMSLEEKIDYIGGTGFAVRAVPSVGLPPFEMSDGPFGVRSNERFPSTTYAIGVGLAASGYRSGGKDRRSDRQRRAGPRHSFHAGPRREHLPLAAKRPQLRVFWRRSIPHILDRGWLH